ncbi:sodium:proton antiporter NhaD [Gynuella sunshinyii]|uniref:Na+/H+ antiporter NhaD and related arsenite permease n=1 Tax=Gynuella sunshinyii YC6258 TaxID=1445510 RepID=A0A0C5VU64_9GAMM|nr:sodium:proton antiporter NhaD [Gynuella sunshinyii]AJQ96843.1 Na+/H+ antiporter NhaD and related arsenite permease [Gynuella sunshinyii YC6258]
MLNIILVALAVVALLGVVLEEKIHINKAKTTLFVGTISWIILFISSSGTEGHESVIDALGENIAEIASLWLFLLAAMTFVAYLNKKGMIENMIYIILPNRISERALMFLVAIFCFVFSSLADNITATLVSMALILSLRLSDKKTIKFATLVVFSVNSGGVSLITGDVTTLMVFLAGKVSIIDLLYLIAPALAAVMVLAVALSMTASSETIEISRSHSKEVRQVDMLIGITFLCTIVGTILLNIFFQIPPVLTFLTGLSLMFLIARFFNEDIDEDPIMEYIRIIEFETLMFFLGVLMIVGVLKEIHVLNSLVQIYHVLPPFAANYLMGLLSAAIDNVPLTAALLKAGIDMAKPEWMVLTYSVGVGGSLLVIGSAAGVVAMSKVKGLTFGAYIRYFPLLLLSYTLGCLAVYGMGQLVFT